MTKQYLTLIRISAFYTLLSITGVYITGATSPFLLLLATAVIVFRLLFARKIPFRKREQLSDILATVILVSYLIIRITFTGASLIVGLIETLILFQGFKWVGPLLAKDFFILTGIAYIEVVASASLTSTVLFFPIFVLVTVFTTIILFILFLFSESEKTSAHKKGEIPLQTHFITFLGGVGLCSLLITIIIFISIPRLGIGFFGRKTVSGQEIPGAAGKIDLKKSTFSNIDGNVIARIKGNSHLVPPLYMKSVTLSQYRNDTWFKRGQRINLTGKGKRYPLRGETSNEAEKSIEVFLDATGESSLLILPDTTAIRWDWGRLYMDQEGDVLFGFPISYPVRYTLFLNRTAGEEPAVKSLYFARDNIPDSIFWITRLLGSEDMKDSDKVRVIKNYLIEHFRYDRTPRMVSLGLFLNGNKPGNCQHFATSTVLMARAMGLAARLAGGYITSEYNDIGNYWMFRQKDAHAWAEVYLDGTGWTIIDSTPTDSLHLIKKNRLNHILDWIRQNWQEYVLGYNLEKQMKLSRGILRGSLKLGKNMKSTLKVQSKFLSLPILITIMILLSLRIFPTLKTKIPWKNQTNRVYKRFLLPIIRDGEKLGITKGKTDTPSEYLDKIGERLELQTDEIQRFLHLYNRARFYNISFTEYSNLKEMTKRITLAIGKKDQSSLSFRK